MKRPTVTPPEKGVKSAIGFMAAKLLSGYRPLEQVYHLKGHADRWPSFNRELTKAIKAGWEPQGGVVAATYHPSDPGPLYSVLMVRRVS